MAYIDSASTGAVDLRSPRVWLSLAGTQIPCLSATVTRKSERKADTFSAELDIFDTALSGFGLAEWADYQPVDVQVMMALDALSAPTSMITGMIDEPRINWDEMTVTVAGRDKSASLIERRRSQKFANQKSSEIVSTIAKDHGLSVSATDSSDLAGKIYDQDTNHLVLNRSDYEVLSDLAEREGFRWYVDGTTLYFEPKGGGSTNAVFYWYPPGVLAAYGVATITKLTTHRNMTAAKPHKLNVASWHHKDKKRYLGTGSAGGVGDSIDIEHHHNGKTQAQADKLANSRVKDAIRHDCNIIIVAPADFSLDVRQQIELRGTATIYDQPYDTDSIIFEVAWAQGAEMTINGKIAKAGRI